MQIRNSIGTRLRTTALLLALGGAAVLGACTDGGVAPGAESGLAVTVKAAQTTATSGRLQIRGPANRTLNLTPGAEQEIALPPGSYTVALEGLAGGNVVEFWQRQATVTEGRQTALVVNLAPFRLASAPSAPAQARVGETFVVSWSPVSGADGYDLQASTSPTFATVSSELDTTQPSAEVTVDASTPVYFRVRARTPFNGVSAFSPISSATQVTAAVASVTVTPQDEAIQVGQTLTYQAVLRDAQGNTVTGPGVTWSSSDPSVATIDPSSGLATAVGGGATTIQATAAGVTGSSTLTVTEVPASVVVDPSSVSLPVGGTSQLTASVRSASGTVLTGFTVTWSSDDPQIASVDGTGFVTGVGGGSTAIRATVDGFGDVSGTASVNVDAGSPPTVTAFDVDFLPFIESCRQDGGDFRTVGQVAYTDADGDMDPARTFDEPGGSAPPQNIDTQFRSQGNTVWLEFADAKSWSPATGATGASGRLDDQDPTCFRGGDSQLEYIDFRVRVRDSAGNWSDWFETRRHLPQQVTVTPVESVALAPGGPGQDFEVSIVDFAGNPLPPELATWSAYIGPGFSTIDANGAYRLLGSDGGLDWVWARAAYAQTRTGVQVIPPVFNGIWFSPGWIFNALDTTISFRTRVYAGREYTFTVRPNAATTGEIDVYVRFGAEATVATFDAASTNAGMNDEVTFVAPSDGVVWTLLNVVAAPDSGAGFEVGGDSQPPRARESLPAGGPAAVSGGRGGGVQDLGLGPRTTRAATPVPLLPLTVAPRGGS